MNLIKFKLVTSDEFVINSAIVLDASRLAECVVTGATMVVTFDVGETNSILTWTFDGTDAAEKLLNATYAQTELLDMVATVANRAQPSVLNFFPPEETIDEWGSRLGIVHTGGTAGTGLASIVLS